MPLQIVFCLIQINIFFTRIVWVVYLYAPLWVILLVHTHIFPSNYKHNTILYKCDRDNTTWFLSLNMNWLGYAIDYFYNIFSLTLYIFVFSSLSEASILGGLGIRARLDTLTILVAMIGVASIQTLLGPGGIYWWFFNPLVVTIYYALQLHTSSCD